MKRIVLALAAILSVAALAGCGGGDPHGTVVGTRYIPAHDYNVSVEDWSTVCYSNSTGGVSCYPVVIGTHLETRHADSAWFADLQNCQPGKGCAKSTADISKQEFDTWILGEAQFPFQRVVDRCVNDPKNVENALILACIRKENKP